ncbi:creatininase [Chthonobacter rhizosphaerae]|uniref:creatininase n=1 Tax=Chthonobacter rhizosphaerae TaxID=2735553 RepID=UPI001AEDFD2A|nr:creatininase [Chthonobacter rhizosphaerae]
MTRPFRMADLSWTDYRDRLAEEDPVVLVPVGAIEQHGPHLPLATDCLIPEAVCGACASRGGRLLAPSITYGYKSLPRCGGGQHFCGTTSVDAATLINQVKDMVREFARHGVSKLAFVVGHMENTWFVNEACDLALREARMLGLKAPRIMTVGYWEFLGEDTIRAAFGDTFPDWSLEHAGIMETSVMLHLHPSLVTMDRLRPHPPAKLPLWDMWPYDERLVPADGVLATAIGASAEKGRLFYDEYVATLSGALDTAFAEPAD